MRPLPAQRNTACRDFVWCKAGGVDANANDNDSHLHHLPLAYPLPVGPRCRGSLPLGGCKVLDILTGGGVCAMEILGITGASYQLITRPRFTLTFTRRHQHTTQKPRPGRSPPPPQATKRSRELLWAAVERKRVGIAEISRSGKFLPKKGPGMCLTRQSHGHILPRVLDRGIERWLLSAQGR
jgi:hypothetical protein